MGRSSLAPIVHFLNTHFERSESAVHSDGNLLDRFTINRDQRAFEALLDRHAPMVWGVCRRVLKRVHDVEDAFQATFLVLVRKAKSIRRRPSVSSWLHSVAYRVALEALAHSEREFTQERKKLMRTGTDASDSASFHEVQAILDEEITSLPERLRAPLLLCCLGGRTKAEAARELGWKEGTVASRLARARERLEGRLTRRGVALAAGSVALVMAQNSSAAVPARMVATTVRMASLIAAGEAASAGGVSTSATLLAKGAIQGMTMTKLKATIALILTACALGTGAGWAANQAWEKDPPPVGTKEESSQPGERAGAPEADEKPAAKKDFYGDPLPPGILARMGNSQLRHMLADMRFSEDGKTLISAGADGMVRHWDLETKKRVNRTVLEKIDRSIGWKWCCFLTLSGDGKTAVAKCNNKLQVFDATTGKELWSVGDEKTWLGSVAISFDGKLVAAKYPDSSTDQSPDGTPDCPLHLFDGRTGNERHVLPYTSDNDATFAFSPDGKLIGVAGAKDIRLWDTETGKEQLKIDAGARVIAFSPDGKLFVTDIHIDKDGSRERGKDVVVWDTKTGTKQATLTSSKVDEVGVANVAFSLDGKVLAIGSHKAITLWDMKKYTEIRQIEQMGVIQFTFSPDGKKLASSGLGAIRLWDVGTGKALHEQGHGGEVAEVAVSPDGKVIASLGVCDALRLWDAATGKPLHALGRLNPNWWVQGCSFSPDGKYAIGTSNDNAVHFWEVGTGKEAREYSFNLLGEKEDVADIRDLRISLDGKRLTAVGFEPGLVPKLVAWDVETRKSIGTRAIKGGFNYALSPDGTTVALWNIHKLSIEDALADKSRTLVNGDFGGGNCNHYSPDGKFLAVTTLRPEKESDPQPNMPWETRVDGIRFIRVEDGKESFRIETPPFDHFAFARDGKMVATVHNDALRLWEIATGKELFQVKRPESYHCVQETLITCLDFMPNGKALVTGMGDGTVLVWDLAPAGWSAKDRPKDLDGETLASLWSDVAGENSRAYEAMWILSESPKQALPFLKEQVKPLQGIDPKLAQRFLAELNDPEFETREMAAKELAKMRHEIEPALRKALDGNPSAETRRRVQEILDIDPSRVVETSERLRVLRAIQVLERIGSKEAAEILRKIAGGAVLARETQEAKEALERLGR
jgi:RNA polymerase sigma factor (sigma-70 family)